LGICASGAGAACDFHKKVASYRINVRNEHMQAQPQEDQQESEDDGNHDYCDTCGQGSKDDDDPLIMCDGCPISYHLTCLQKLPGQELINTIEDLPKQWYCGHIKCRGSEPSVSSSRQSQKRQREQQFKPPDSEVQQIVLYVGVDSPFSYGKAEKQREMWGYAVARCRDHGVAKGATAKQLAIWMAKICESHFHANPTCHVSPSSVLDYLTREWLLPRVSSGKVSAKTKVQAALAANARASSCHVPGSQDPSHNVITRANRSEQGSVGSPTSGSITSASVPSSIASSAPAFIGSQLPTGFASFHREILDLERKTFPDTTTKLDNYVASIMVALGVESLNDLATIEPANLGECHIPVLHKQRLKAIMAANSMLNRHE